MKSNQFRVVKKTINCFHSNIYFPWLLVYLPWLTGILKSPRCDIIDWHYDRGLNNSKLTVWSSITVADGGMRVWHFNGVITTYGKRDCRKFLAIHEFGGESRGIKAGFYCIYKINARIWFGPVNSNFHSEDWNCSGSKLTLEVFS